MKKHPMAGTPVKIEDGVHKGQYFKVIDYLVNQFQGKDVEKIAAMQPRLVTPVVGRGYPLDDQIVFGELYPTMEKICVHDDELKIKTAKPPLKIVEEEKTQEVADDTTRTSSGDNQDSSAGSAESDGRSVPSDTVSQDNGGEVIQLGKTKSDAGSGAGGEEQKDSPPRKRKTKAD